MPPNRSAAKRSVQAKRRALRNAAIKSRTKTALRRFREALELKDEVAMQEKLQQVSQALDKAVTKGVIHRNAAARKKSRLYKMLQSRAAQQ